MVPERDTRVKKGAYDTTNYRNDVLGVANPVPQSAPFRKILKLTTEQNSEYGLLDPIQMPHSRQIYNPDLAD